MQESGDRERGISMGEAYGSSNKKKNEDLDVMTTTNPVARTRTISGGKGSAAAAAGIQTKSSKWCEGAILIRANSSNAHLALAKLTVLSVAVAWGRFEKANWQFRGSQQRTHPSAFAQLCVCARSCAWLHTRHNFCS